MGATPLKPEKSFNLSAGTVVNVGRLAVTIDYYRVKVQDRIAQTDQLPLCNGRPLSAPECTNIRSELIRRGAGTDVSSFTNLKYFTNAFDTTTQGIDVVATYPMNMAGGDTLLTFAGNWNQTQVTEFDPTVISSKRVIQLEENLPNFRFTLTADHLQGPWRFLTRLHYYHDFVEFHVNDDDSRIDASERLLVDAETSYTFNTMGVTVAAGAQSTLNPLPMDSTADSIT